MLKQRVITAVVLLVVLIGTMFSGYQWPFGVILSLISAAALWEWLRLSMANRFHFLALPLAVLSFMYFVYVIYRHEQYLFVPGAVAPDAWTMPLMLLSPAVLAYWIFGAGFLLLIGFSLHKTHTVTLIIFVIV